MSGDEEPEESGELVHLEMGLRPFSTSDEVRCPKCRSLGVNAVWHLLPIFNALRTYPCEDWMARGLLGGSVGEHLCRTCTTCGYGWPERTADS